MRFLRKTPDSCIRAGGWRYPAHRQEIHDALWSEQVGFCAYSEKVLMPTDARDIEHYDDRLKKTDADGFANWYLVSTWFNRGEPRIVDHLPIVEQPGEEELSARVTFDGLVFQPRDEDDVAVRNLLKFIGDDRPELVAERRAHLDRVVTVLHVLGNDLQALSCSLREEKRQLSFITALEHTLRGEVGEVVDGVDLLVIARQAKYP